LIGYQRRRCSWWKSLGLWLWWNGDRLSGLLELGSIKSEEFFAAFQRREVTALRPIGITDVRFEVYKAARSIVSVKIEKQRYQPLKVAIEPVRRRKPPMPTIDHNMVEPAPVIF
jgi:hypothetical protein